MVQSATPALPSRWSAVPRSTYVAVSLGPTGDGLDGARQVREVFLALQSRARALSAQTLRQLNRLATGLRWPLRPFFLACERELLLACRLASAASAPPARDDDPDEPLGQL